MLAYRLNNPINGEKLLKDIQKLIQNSVVSDKEYLMVIKIQEISYDDDKAIPKLEHHNLDEKSSTN